jgi:hypothetical protein
VECTKYYEKRTVKRVIQRGNTKDSDIVQELPSVDTGREFRCTEKYSSIHGNTREYRTRKEDSNARKSEEILGTE